FVLPSPQESGWIYSNSSFFTGILPDSSYYVGIGFDGPAGTVFNIGADTAGYHHFSTETVARQNGNWTSLSFVPVMELVCDPEGIPEKEQIHPAIYPNPAHSTLSIDHVRDAKISLYDLTGKLLLEDLQSSPSRKLNISGFSPGIYFVRITANSYCISKKCVVR
ncbi:MAG: T9SS type A sorting domain-containing protein, partial [Bacteroidota bacterium]